MDNSEKFILKLKPDAEHEMKKQNKLQVALHDSDQSQRNKFRICTTPKLTQILFAIAKKSNLIGSNVD